MPEALPNGSEPNWLLAALPDSARDALLAQCERVDTPVEMIISEGNERMEYAYFPSSGCLSVVTVQSDKMEAEAGSVGWEGMTGLSLLHRVSSVPTRCIVQVGGSALRVPTDAFIEQLTTNRPLLALMHRYAQFWSEQSSWAIGCNGLHTIEQRCARWLLHTHDRVDGDVVPLTQEFLAVMLAVRRASVSLAAESLQKQGLITYRRGKIVIVDRAGLEEAACYCYGAIQSSYHRLLPARVN
jgi:CRP-like cAMP-binding protein